ncbi:glycosyltransferase family 2 protein [Mariprofundus ferrooxydans]|nr:glycosyltransferase family 2 protein [Mariprofundus ferrooxydans]
MTERLSNKTEGETEPVSNKAKLSIYIIAYNEADKIADAVSSALWADEVIVADSHSSDNTAVIAESLGARVVQLDFNGFGKLRNDAIAACSHDWVFSLDADERCTPEAAEEISSIINRPDAADLWYTPRRNWFMGRWIKHCGWYPDYRQPQLFRKHALIFNNNDEVHEGFETHGSIDYMQHAIWQIPFKDLSQVQEKGKRYSSLGAIKLERNNVSASMGKALARGLWAFFRIYILKLGFIDGWAGFVIAFGNLEGTFYRYAKLNERQKALNKPPSLP